MPIGDWSSPATACPTRRARRDDFANGVPRNDAKLRRNICAPDPDRYANIMRMNRDGGGLVVYARGIRNSVGFDWDPRTKDLWFTSNGRDRLGGDEPPDTLNHAPRAGMNFGYRYCHAGEGSLRPEFGDRRVCSERLGPPADSVAADGSLLVSDDQAGAIYRVRYRGQ